MILGFNIVKYLFFSKNDYLELKLINMMINMHLNDKYMILGFNIVKYVFFL